MTKDRRPPRARISGKSRYLRRPLDLTQRAASPPLGPESADDDEGHPSTIGPYRIIEVLGEGGMGRVYLAEQSEPIRRRVALKILKRGMDTDDVVARFESERQALALLEHTNIARVFDAAATHDGRPYFIMELVHGTPITDYSDGRRLTTQERLRLFVAVCEAVQHAHFKGLVHRDLKPSNILVGDADGRATAKVIDFGIAKAMGENLTDHTMATRMGEILGTPQYMSPEQAGVRERDVDARTDVYSLGIVLYELLVGRPPFKTKGLARAVMAGALWEMDPPRPSTRFTGMGEHKGEIARARGSDPDTLRKQLVGDLDWIVMKAIEKDRNRRYATPNELAQDLERYLGSRPVSARPPSAGYLLRRFVRRHRVGVAASVAVLLATASALVAASLGLAARSREVAERETSEQFVEYVELLLATINPLSGPGDQASLTERASWTLDRWMSPARQPVVAGRLHLEVATGFIDERQWDSAQVHLARASDLYGEALGHEHPNYASVLRTQAELAREQGQLAEAKTRVDQALILLAEAPNAADQPALLSDVFREAAMVYQDMGDFEVADSLYTRTLDLAIGDVSEVQVWSLKGAASFEKGDLEGARADWERAWTILGNLEGEDARKTEVLTNLNNVYVELGEVQEAAAVGNESVALARRTHAQDAITLGIVLGNQAITLARAGRVGEATELSRESLALHRSGYSEDDPGLARTLMNTGVFLAEQGGSVEEGIELTAEALGIVGTNPPPPAERWVIGAMHVNHGRALKVAGRFEEAEVHFLEGLAIIEEAGSADLARIIERYRGYLADMYDAWGRRDRAAEIRASLSGPDPS